VFPPVSMPRSLGADGNGDYADWRAGRSLRPTIFGAPLAREAQDCQLERRFSTAPGLRRRITLHAGALPPGRCAGAATDGVRVMTTASAEMTMGAGIEIERFRWTVVNYHRMVEVGLVGDDAYLSFGNPVRLSNYDEPQPAARHVHTGRRQ